MRIGEVATASGTTRTTLRFYEDAGLLPHPGRTPGGYRDYDADVLPRLDFIRRSRAAGLSLAQTREVLDLRDDGSVPCRHVRDLLAARLADLDRQIADLTALRDVVRHRHAAAAAAQPQTCEPGTVCRYL